MKIFQPDVTLRTEDYEKLIATQREAKRIVDLHNRLVREEHDRYRYARGKAIFRTKDGLEAVGEIEGLPYGFTPLRRPCLCIPKPFLVSDVTASDTSCEFRTYEFIGEVILGVPVYIEI